jgi:single-strand DNA-binding protein
MSVNKAILIGNLGGDVTMHYFENGGCIGKFSLATSETYTNSQTGEKVTNTEWHNIIVSNKQAEICEKYLGKGDKIYLEGKITTRKWQDTEGKTRYSTEIRAITFKFLTTKNKSEQAQNTPSPSTGEPDDLPF